MPMKLFKGQSRELESFFGSLETRVLDSLWDAGTPQSVRDLQPLFAGVAYTTLMTTLDRLHRKGVLDRVKAGRAFLYVPRYSREQLRSQLASDALHAVFGDRATDLAPILSFFVETVSREDKDALDALERLIAEHRRVASERAE